MGPEARLEGLFETARGLCGESIPLEASTRGSAPLISEDESAKPLKSLALRGELDKPFDPGVGESSTGAMFRALLEKHSTTPSPDSTPFQTTGVVLWCESSRTWVVHLDSGE